MNLVDSSGWLEFFADGKNADFFADPITKTDELLVSTINLYEVFKRILQQRNQDDALQAVAVMRQGIVINVDETLALQAAKFGQSLKLPLADSIIFATAQAGGATLWTQDADFKSLEGVRYIKKEAAAG